MRYYPKVASIILLMASLFLNAMGQAPAQEAGPQVKRDTLLNGLKIMLVERPGSGSLRIHLRVNSGAMFDLAGKGGLAYMTAGMLFSSGGGLGSKGLAETTQRLGVKLSVNSGWDSADFVITGPADSLQEAVELLGQLILNPAFDQKELDSLKAARTAEAAEEAREPGEIALDKAAETIYGTFPFGHPALGTAESVARISRDDLLYYYKKFYIANNAELLFIGDTSMDQIMPLVRGRLGAWKKGSLTSATFRPPEPAPSGPRVAIVNGPSSAQPAAVIAQTGFSRRSSDYYAAITLTRLLESMNAEAVKKAAPQASIRTWAEPRYLAGPLFIEIQSPSGQMTPAVEATLKVMDQLKAGQFEATRLESARQSLIASFQDQIKTDDGLARALLDVEQYGLGRDYLLKYGEWISAVQADQVVKAANSYFQQKWQAVAVAGPVSDIEDSLKRLGGQAPVKP